LQDLQNRCKKSVTFIFKQSNPVLLRKKVFLTFFIEQDRTESDRNSVI